MDNPVLSYLFLYLVERYTHLYPQRFHFIRTGYNTTVITGKHHNRFVPKVGAEDAFA